MGRRCQLQPEPQAVPPLREEALLDQPLDKVGNPGLPYLQGPLQAGDAGIPLQEGGEGPDFRSGEFHNPTYKCYIFINLLQKYVSFCFSAGFAAAEDVLPVLHGDKPSDLLCRELGHEIPWPPVPVAAADAEDPPLLGDDNHFLQLHPAQQLVEPEDPSHVFPVLGDAFIDDDVPVKPPGVQGEAVVDIVAPASNGLEEEEVLVRDQHDPQLAKAPVEGAPPHHPAAQDEGAGDPLHEEVYPRPFIVLEDNHCRLVDRLCEFLILLPEPQRFHCRLHPQEIPLGRDDHVDVFRGVLLALQAEVAATYQIGRDGCVYPAANPLKKHPKLVFLEHIRGCLVLLFQVIGKISGSHPDGVELFRQPFPGLSDYLRFFSWMKKVAGMMRSPRQRGHLLGVLIRERSLNWKPQPLHVAGSMISSASPLTLRLSSFGPPASRTFLRMLNVEGESQPAPEPD